MAIDINKILDEAKSPWLFRPALHRRYSADS